MSLSIEDRSRVIERARNATCRRLGITEDKLSDGGLCFYLSHFVCLELHKLGVRAIPQAGSASWQFRHNDSTTGPTVVEYVWSPEGPIFGKLPEVHVWAAIPDTVEIIDASLPSFRAVANVLREDFIHPGYELPDYLWCPAAETPDHCSYRVDAHACIFVAKLFQKEFKPAYLPKLS